MLLLPFASGRAQEGVPPRASLSANALGPETNSPAVPLLRLENALTKVQEEKKQGLIDETRYREFLKGFRADLASEMDRIDPTPADAVLHARILSRLGDSEQAAATLRPALEQDPDSPSLRLALSRIRYDHKDYPGALAEANAVLARDPANKEALALKHSSAGRIGTGGTASDTQRRAGAAAAERSRSPLAKDSAEVQALIPRIRDARDHGDMPAAMSLAQELMRIEPASVRSQEIYRSVTQEHARWQRVQKTVGRIDRAEAPEKPAPPNGGIPLWPILPISGLGAAAFVVAKSRRTVESQDGFDEENRPRYGRLQRFVAGAVLAGLAGAGIYLTGAAAIPVAARYLTATGRPVPMSAAVGTRLGNDEAVVTASRWVKPESGYYDVMLHGSPDRFWINRAGKWIDIDHRSLATFIKKQNDYGGRAIRLLSCQTGACEKGVAKNLANKLGVPVKAPTDTLYVYDGGKMVIGPNPSQNTGKWKVFMPGEAK